MNGLLNGFFTYWMIEWFNEWFNESIFKLLSEIICSRCIVIFIVDALLFGLWNSEINCYLQVYALGLGSWEWCGGGGAILFSTSLEEISTQNGPPKMN